MTAALNDLSATLGGKNQDYRIDGEFSNFEYAAKVAGTTVEQAILTQVGIKVGRLIGLSDNPNNESRIDTYKDLAGYAVILHAYNMSKHTKEN